MKNKLMQAGVFLLFVILALAAGFAIGTHLAKVAPPGGETTEITTEPQSETGDAVTATQNTESYEEDTTYPTGENGVVKSDYAISLLEYVYSDECETPPPIYYKVMEQVHIRDDGKGLAVTDPFGVGMQKSFVSAFITADYGKTWSVLWEEKMQLVGTDYYVYLEDNILRINNAAALSNAYVEIYRVDADLYSGDEALYSIYADELLGVEEAAYYIGIEVIRQDDEKGTVTLAFYNDLPLGVGENRTCLCMAEFDKDMEMVNELFRDQEAIDGLVAQSES